MKQLAIALGVCVAILGVIGVVSPATLAGFTRQFQTQAGLYAAAAFRIVLGIALVVAAPGSRMPVSTRILGVIVLGAGLALPFIGLERVRPIVDWWSSQSDLVLRSWAIFAVGFGAFLVWVFLPKSGSTES